MEYRTEELAKEFLEEFYRLGRLAQSKTISHSMKGEAFRREKAHRRENWEKR